MAAVKGTIYGVSAAWIAKGFTVVNGQITGGTVTIDSFDFVAEQSPAWAAPADSATSVISVQHAGRVTVEFPEVTTVIDGVTGNEKEGGSGTSDKSSITLLDTLPATLTKVKNYRGIPVVICYPHGHTADGAALNFYYQLAKLTSETKVTFGSGGVSSLPMEFSGASHTASDPAGETALKITFPAITPVGSATAVTPPAIVDADLADLLAGKIVQKAGS